MATNQMRREAAKRKLERQRQRRAQRARRRRQITVITAAAVAVIVVAGVVALSVNSGRDSSAAAADQGATTITPETIPTEAVALPTRPTPLPETVTCEYPASGQAAKPVNPPAAGEVSARGTVSVSLNLDSGVVPLTLDRSLAPCTVHSFLSLAEQGYFDNTSCHRLTTSPGLQVLQCGDPTGTGRGGPGYRFADETFPELTYGRGVLAMANSGPDTNGSQFFMVYGDAALPPNYTVFGSIGAEGLAVLDEIARTGHNGAYELSAGGGVPVRPVTIQRVTLS